MALSDIFHVDKKVALSDIYCMINVHERIYPGHDASELGVLLDAIGSDDDRLWTRTGNFPPMRLAGPLSELPAGGHGFVRYHTVEHQPGASVTWRFEHNVGIDGTHRLEVIDADGGAGLRHTIDGRTTGAMRILWPLAVRCLHDACLEELLDRAAATLADAEPPPPRHGFWVRSLLRIGPSPAKEQEAWLPRAG